MNWKIEFFNEMVEKQTLAFPKGILADFLRVVELIEEFGPAIGRPHTAPLSKGLFEIRAKGREGIGRSIFCSVRDRKLIILHSFVKKTQKIPQKEMDKALKRLKEVTE
jgi:phage-related protein